jgi:Zn-dependent peptidase ImmA (M78 family)/transcriptional regulator with XRE-family HTH domain
MRQGTPGFVGERLREAREARGVSGIALAEMLGVSRQAISQYELGTSTPGIEVLEKAASVLNVTPQFFRAARQRAPIGTVFYRSFSSATKTARVRVERRLGWLKEVVQFLEEHVEFPEVDLPIFEGDPMGLSNAEIEVLAARTRVALGVPGGPMPNLVVLLENHGVVVSRFEVGTRSLDAFSEWSPEDGRPYVVLSSDKSSAVRSRMDAAHELGHLVLHRAMSDERLRDKAVFALIEDQAYRFAGALLLPADEFSDDFCLPTLGELRHLKEKWLVSMALIVKRCEALDLLPEREITRLYIALGRQGWKTREPLDDELEPESPRSLRDAFELILNEGVQSRLQIRSSLHFSQADIEDLAGLPTGSLAEPKPGVVVELRNRSIAVVKDSPAQVVKFPERN